MNKRIARWTGSIITIVSLYIILQELIKEFGFNWISIAIFFMLGSAVYLIA